LDTSLEDRLQDALGDGYVLERELAPGGMSRLFLAAERALERTVVVKLLPPDYASEMSAERFRREMLVTARLQHPHILPVLNAGARDGLLYYVMPYVPGESLRGRMEREPRLPVAEAVRILREIVDALACAHDAGVVHRDVKPENVLFQHDHAVLADFGVARALDAASPGPRLTSTGLGLGTLGYMAPEQLGGEPDVDARADLYAVGVVAYEMLAGEPPFRGATLRVLAAHLTEAPPPLARVRPDVPAPLAELVARLLEKAPADRPQAAREVLRALESIATPRRASGRAPRPPNAPEDAPGGDPHELLLAMMGRDAPLPPELVAYIRSIFVPRTFRKGQVFERPGEVSTRGGFVTRGLFRTYSVDANGNESIVRFSPEGAWFGDLQSATTGALTSNFVEAIEPSEALLVDMPSFERLIQASPDKGRGYRMGLQRSREAMERRIALYLHASAEERYADFVQRHPALATRVPQRMLASYLGISPETLSRVRRKLKER
jgi:eukaryotic-like serine/threonine-protein kinase